MKLWDKGIAVNKKIEDFTVGRDRELDVELAPFDIMGTMAHIIMLEKVGLLEREELALLLPQLKVLYRQTQEQGFVIEEGIEDVHSQVELLLTQALGDVGKKVHSGRSRSDQVLLDLKLYTCNRLMQLNGGNSELFEVLQQRSYAHKDDLLPGYTHLQVAMPSSFGLWFWCLCREPGRRYASAAGRLAHCKSESPGSSSRLRQQFSARSRADYPFAGF